MDVEKVMARLWRWFISQSKILRMDKEGSHLSSSLSNALGLLLLRPRNNTEKQRTRKLD